MLAHAHVHLQEANDSYDFVNSDSDPTPKVDIFSRTKESHGTGCAGIIGMKKDNHKCGVGVAYHAKLAGPLNKAHMNSTLNAMKLQCLR